MTDKTIHSYVLTVLIKCNILYLKEFIKGGNMEKSRVNITMPTAMLERVDQTVKELGMNRSALINFIIKNYFDSQDMIQATKNMTSEGNITALAEKLAELSKK